MKNIHTNNKLIILKIQLLLKYSIKLSTTLAITLFLFACNSTKLLPHNIQSTLLHQESQYEFEQLVRNTEIKAKILEQYTIWKGVIYRFGGTTKKGVDCSAFAQRLFSEKFGISLPRSTNKQQYIGRRVKQQNLRPGDLIFFKTSPTNRHVGIYIGNYKFIHASTSRGVTVSTINNNYWSRCYYTARRIINSY